MELDNDADVPRNPNNPTAAGFPPPPDTDELDSSCSTPYHSAPSSPSRPYPLYYFSAPTSPMHYICAAATASASDDPAPSPPSFEFEFSARLSDSTAASAASMISADELFLNGQIRPMKVHLPQILSDPDEDDEQRKDTSTRGRDTRLRSRSVHRRARSMSPLRNTWPDEEELDAKPDPDPKEIREIPTPSVSASTSRSSSSSSSGRSSRRWMSLKDLLYRSKSEGRANPKDRFWHGLNNPSQAKTSFFARRQKEKGDAPGVAKRESGAKVSARKAKASAHERHYAEKRAEAEEMRRRTFLPYRAGLLGCLGFSSRGYGAVSGIARTWNAVSSR